MVRKAGDDYASFVERTNKIPAVKDYLESLPVVIGDLVLHHRMNRGWTQQQLAAEAKTNQATISKIEAGNGGTKMDTVGKVLRALEIDKQIFEALLREDAAGTELVGSR